MQGIIEGKEIYKAAHKAATNLYAIERSKEGGGMTLHEVTEEEWAKILAARCPKSNTATDSGNNGTISNEKMVELHNLMKLHKW